MKQETMACSLMIEGTVLSCPARVIAQYEQGEITFGGEVRLEEKGAEALLPAIDSSLASQYGAYVSSLVPVTDTYGSLSYAHGLMTFCISRHDLYFKTVAGKGGGALLFSFESSQTAKGEAASALMEAVGRAAGFFGLSRFYLFGRTAKGPVFSDMTGERGIKEAIPRKLAGCSLITYSHLVLDGNSVFTRAVEALFGLKETGLFLAVSGNGFFCMADIPAFHTASMEGRDMYLELGVENKQTALSLHGTFRFSFIPAMEFSVDCSVAMTRFTMEAYASCERPIPLAGPFSIGDTCLAVGYDTGPSFGMFTNLYIGEIRIFGAVLLKLGPAVKLDMISAAVSDLSLPILVKNLLNISIPGIETIDFIRILGLPFQEMEPFERSVLDRADGVELAGCFNRRLSDKNLVLEAERVKASAWLGGVSLVDERRMRQYYIDGNGRLKLMAQFYYADTDTKLGNYSIEKGVFLCGVIEIFKARLEVLFSFREGEGVLAYGRIPSVDLGFLRLGPSSFSKGAEGGLPIAADSLLYQFMGKKQEGIVFFLSAVKNDVTIYLDGRIELLKILCFESRIIFCKGLVSIDVHFGWLSIFYVNLHIRVDYGNFTSGGFEFLLVIDTSGLAEKLKSVQQCIKRAIEKYRNRINSARSEIDRAQDHVNELYGQIDSFNQRIAGCRRSVKKAKWWKKAFVAIAKGIEIGAYEVAKAGVYAAIGVATAALAVAKKVVEAAGAVGEAVMKAVNGIIQGVLSFFYINRLELYGKANAGEQRFRASIEFVALGKTYRYETHFQSKSLQSDAAGAVSSNLNGQMEDDLNHIDDGAYKSNRRRYRHETYTAEQQCSRMAGAREQLRSSAKLMRSMQEAYIREFGEPTAEFDEMNVSFLEAVDSAAGIFKVTDQTGDMKALSRSMGGLKRSVKAREKNGAFRGEELSQLNAVISEYDHARLLYSEVKKSIRAVESQRERMGLYVEAQKARTDGLRDGKLFVKEQAAGSMERVLNKTEEAMYRQFPVDRSGKTYINLSREPEIHRCFDEARASIGAETPETVEAMRIRSRKGVYEKRL